MLDVSERLRELVDGSEPPVTMADVETVLANRSQGRVLRSRPVQRRRKTGVLVTTAVVVAAVLIGIVAIPGSTPVTSPIVASTPVALDVPSTPKLEIKLPNDAIDGHRILWARVPSYVPLYLGTEQIGYVTRSSVEHPPLIAAPAFAQPSLPSGPSLQPSCVLVSPDSPEVVKVFNASRALVGWIFPTSGFVRVGDGQTCGP
jgi:hypothetical protein